MDNITHVIISGSSKRIVIRASEGSEVANVSLTEQEAVSFCADILEDLGYTVNAEKIERK